MNDILELLLKSGFEKKSGDTLSKVLFCGYSFELTPEHGNWAKDQDIYLYLFSEKFGKLMNKGFSRYEEFFNSYKPRKLIKDTSGCLSMVLSLLRKNDAGEQLFCSGKIDIRIQDLITILSQIKSPEDVFYNLYKGVLGDLMVTIEGVWVYFYLCKESGLSNEQILTQLNQPFMEKNKRRWRLHKWPDNEFLQIFSKMYDDL